MDRRPWGIQTEVLVQSRQARGLLASQRVARLATVRPDGSPHVVPVVFALVGEQIFTCVDGKPKTTLQLQRLRNIADDPRVAVLGDFYSEDWATLWWVRADGVARIAQGPEREFGLGELTAKYPQYETQSPPGAVVAIDVLRWSGWASS